jgi:ATP-dependent DNA helicase RecG
MKPLFNEPELRSLLQQDEGQFLEFKSLWDLTGGTPKVVDRRAVRDMIAQCIAAFANADGGTLLLGVDNDGTPSGHGYPEEAVTEFLAVPERRLRPSVAIRHQRITLDSKEVIVIQVNIEPEAVMVDGDGFPYRVGDQIRLEPQEVINQRKQAYRTVGYDRRVQPEATLDDLDLGLARDFLAGSVYRDRPAEDAMGELGLTLAKAGGVAVTNAALLLFAKRPFSRWHPRAGIRMFRVHGTERRHGKHRNVAQLEGPIEPPLALAIPEARRLAAGQIRKSEKLHDLFFREMPEYPEFAWQEAIINAVAHRDYNDQGREIEVWFFDDRMEVLSPGDLVAPVTLEQLRQRRRVHASRNPLLVRVLASVGIMRDEGEGVPRIFEEMQESLLKQPEISVEAAQLAVVLYNEPVASGPTAEWQAVVSRLDLTDAQKQVLLAYPEGFTDEQYQAVNASDRNQARREIEDMMAKGVLSPPAPGDQAGSYRLSRDLRETAAWLEQRTPQLRAFFESHDRLTNADYREIFGVTRFAARHELARLVDEGILVQKGERKAAHYVAGAELAPKP